MKQIENWLVTLANTRLIFNTIQELESFTDNHSIQSNGIKKAFPTPQKQRAVFRDLLVEVTEMTKSQIDLDSLLIEYHYASQFYKKNLVRKSDQKSLALDLLRYLYGPTNETVKNDKLQELANQIIENDVNVPILFLLLIKVLPSYDSKEGDVKNIKADFAEMIAILKEFMQDNTIFSNIPSLLLAHNEKNKCRLTLIWHAANILSTYTMYKNNDDLYERANELKQTRVPLDMEGYWNEYNGTMDSTEFWQFQPLDEEAVFYATHWKKTADNVLIPTRYTVVFNEAEDGSLILYMMHPLAMKNRVNGKPISDMDHAWYICEDSINSPVNNLQLERLLPSAVWAPSIHLTRVVDSTIKGIYDNWIQNTCKIQNPYEGSEYTFYFHLYAITLTHLYITNEKDEGFSFYKVPKDAYPGLETTHITDNVGILTIGDKQYLGFDEIMLYIELTEDNLAKYGIEKVNEIKLKCAPKARQSL